MFKKIASLISALIFSFNLCLNFSQNSSIEKTPELVRVNQSYQIDGNEVLDSSALINRSKQSIEKSSLVSVPNTDWNMLTMNLEDDSMDFFFFDENHYSYRQFAYDEDLNTLKRLDDNSKYSTTQNDSIDCIKPQKYELSDGSVALYTNGYDPDVRINDSNNQEISPTGIIGSDDRVLVSDTTAYPYKRAGVLVSMYKVKNFNTGQIDTIYFGSTGFMEGPDLLVTAGHAVYGDVTSGDSKYDDNIFNPRFPDEIYYYPARNGNTLPYGSTTVERVYLEKSYYLNTEKDWACCKLATKIGNTTGWCGKISYFYQKNFPFETYGYPTSGNYKMYKATAEMTYFEENENGYYYRTNLDADGGQSGSPYIVNLDSGSYACGIHTYSSYYVGSGEAAYSGGIRIDGLMFAFMNSFVASESLYEIKATDYSFADSYPTDDTTKNEFKVHTLSNGLTFRTRRYRTGYIHDEYIVMSPIRDSIPSTTAFIEFSFRRPVEKLSVELSMWRDSSYEILNSTNGSASLQIPGKDGWETKLDLLSPSCGLPTDRTKPKLYNITFSTPVYNFRFYSKYNGTTFVAGENRGRICIGDLTLQFQKNNYMPLNWYELKYEPYEWNDSLVIFYNCYNYALNTKNHDFMQPGSSEGHDYTNTPNYHTKDVLVNMIEIDSKNYSFDFEPIGKYEECDPGYYKIALVADPGSDYHFYRQNSDGTWSHKSGSRLVTNLDFSDNIIYDPEYCDRKDNESPLNYTDFYGFYQVNIANMI